MQCDQCGSNVEVGEGTCFCSQYWHEFTTIKTVILCPGTKKDKSPCKNKIQKEFKFCANCGTKVDPQWFLNIGITCQGQWTDGSVCGNILDKANKFCAVCGTPRPSAVTDSFDKNEITLQSEETCAKEEWSQMVSGPLGYTDSGKILSYAILPSVQRVVSDNGQQDQIDESSFNKKNVSDKTSEVSEVLSQTSGTHHESMEEGNITFVHEIKGEKGTKQEETLVKIESLQEEIEKTCEMQTTVETESRKIAVADKDTETQEGDKQVGEINRVGELKEVREVSGTTDALKNTIVEYAIQTSTLRTEQLRMELNKTIEMQSREKGTKGEDGKHKNSNEGGEKINEDDMTSSLIVTKAKATALQREQLRKNTGKNSADKIGNVMEGTKQNVDDSLVASNREDCKKEETNNKVKKNETSKAEKQEKKNNAREESLTSQNANMDSTYFGRKISNHGDPNVFRFHFHVLVPPDFKLNLDEQNVCIRISLEDLEGSTSHIYPMNHVRQVQKYTEMQICFDMTRHMVFERGFHYRYGIHKTKKNKIKWEKYYISDGGEQESRRYCCLSKTLMAMSEFHLYGGIMNPDISKWNYFKKTFDGNVVNMLEEDAKMSAEIFTEKLLTTGNMAPMPDPETLNMLKMLLVGLKKIYLQDANCWSSEVEFKEVMGKAILSRILKSLESEAETSLSGYTETQQQAERRMQMALFVLTVIGHLKLPLSAHNRSLLARSLLLRPYHETGELHDLAVVLQKSNEEKRRLGIYITQLCNSFQMNDKDPSWLCCTPLLHILSGDVTPCQPPTDDISHDAQEPYWWGIQSVKSAAEQFKQCSRTWMITLQDMIICLSPLFELDYFLPRTLMSVLQLKEVVMVVQTKTVPPEVCIATCIYYIKEKSSRKLLYLRTTEDKFQQIVSAVGMLKEFLAKFEEPRWSDSLLLQHAYLTQRIAEDMVKITFDKRPQYDLVRDVVQMFLEAVALYDTTKEKLQLHESKMCWNQMVLDAHTKVKTWLSQKFSSFSSTEFTDNLMKWNSMLCSINLRSSVVADMWNTFLVDDFKKQWEYESLHLHQMHSGFACETTLVQQYCSLVDSLHPCMQSCLSDLAFKAINRRCNVTLAVFRDQKIARFGRLLSNLFEKNWNDMVEKNGQKEKKILQFALTWSPFAHYKALSAGMKRIYNFLSPECRAHLDLSIAILESLINALQDGKIALEDLQFIHSAEEKFMELTQSSMQTGSDGKSKSDINVCKVIRFRNKEVECYYALAEKIKILLKLCEYVPTVDSSSISKRMKALLDNRQMSVDDICKPVFINGDVEHLHLDKYQPQITAFELPKAVFAILDELESCHRSKLFLHFWKDVQNSKITSLEELVTVWKSIKRDWSEICTEIAQGEITFKKFKENLGNMFQEDYICMEEEMRLMHIDHNVALTRITAFKQNMQLKTCVDGAEVIQRFAENFELVGDFENIKLIASQKEFGQRKMKDFNKNFFETTDKFLMDLNKERINCLESVLKSRDVVQWLKESMKGGLKELKVFVDLASISAGEGDREIAKVQCLHAATTGFAPLIFDLKKEFGYKELQERCHIVWKELDIDPSLPEKLVSLNSELEWLKTVKQTHGSVEVTSLSQAAAINEEGIYRVGKLKRVAETEQDLACMEFKTEVAEDVLNSIKITYGQNGIDSLISSLKQLAKVDTCDERVLVYCDSKHAEDVQKCVISHYSRAEKERTSPKEASNKYLIHGENDNLKEWLEFAFRHTSWSKNLEIEEGKLYLLGSEQMKREVEKAVQSMNNWYQEEFTLSAEEQPKVDEVVAMVKNELPAVFIKQTKERIAVLSDNESNIERAKYKVNMALGRIKITGRRRKHANPQTYDKSFSDTHMSKDDQLDAGLIFPTSSFQSRQLTVDLNAKSYCTKEGLTAKVYFGDLTSLPVDCIVNAANELLSHDGEVALAISKAAGRDFDQEGKEYVKKHGAVPVTQCCVTSSGKLPYKVVIHAVGPRWSDYKYNEKEKCTEDLKKTVANCLIEANKFKMASIAIPSLSSGIFGVPKPLCAQMYAQAVVEYSMTYGVQSVKEIHFVDIIPDMCQLTQSAFDAEFQCI